jgi:hypothetical protein
MIDEEMINNVLEGDNSENEQESSTPPTIRTVRHDDVMRAFNTCCKWAEENNVQTEGILTLKRFQEKALKETFMSRNKGQKTIQAFFL